MDKEEFKQRVAQVAIIKELKPVKTGEHNRLAKEIVIEVDEFGEEYEVEREITENPTLGFALVSLKPVDRPCEWSCGKIVTDQRIETRLVTTPHVHYRTRCVNCSMYQSPKDGKLVDSYQFGRDLYAVKYGRDK
jgi:hypothetical protein